MLNNISIGIMQGRLSEKHGQPLQSFPRDSWRLEFAHAASMGYELIEWLIDNYDNPIATAEGRAEIKLLAAKHNIGVHSLCAHVFINGELFSEGKASEFAENYLIKVLDFAAESSIDFVILPLMERMSLRTMEAQNRLNKILTRVLHESTVTLLLESDLMASDLKKFIEGVGSSKLGVLYDLGNANALDFDIVEDLSILGTLVREVHIKDRMSNNGPSHRLGEGDTPLSQAAEILAKLSWSGPVVLETPTYNDWRQEAEYNLAFTRKWRNVVESK